MSLRIAMVGHVDHGKSTLIGRLLSDTQQTRTERKERVQSLCNSTGRKFEYAFLLDALEEEQSQGITIDVTEVHWNFENREYIFVDTPGHREFLKKMVGGASKVDAAVIILDAAEGLKDSFHRQMKVLDLLGVQSRIVIINKMDLVGWSEEIWLQRRQEVLACLASEAPAPCILPAAVWHGANLLEHSREMPWYRGPTFNEALRALGQKRILAEQPARFFIQDVYGTDGKRIYVGRVEAGWIQAGDVLHFHPGGQSSRIESIEVEGESRVRAEAGQAVGVTFADPVHLDRGYLGFQAQHPPMKNQIVTGDLFWLDAAPVKIGDRLKIKMGTRQAFARVDSIDHEIDGETFNKREKASSIGLFGRVRFKFDEPWAFDSFEQCEPTGRFVASREGLVLGGGRWLGEKPDEVSVRPAPRGAKPSGAVLWLTGLSGAGKSTLAQALESNLRNYKQKVIVLDGDVLRRGLCRDLGFSEADRCENLRRAAEVAKVLADSGFTVITAFISPMFAQRKMARAIIGAERFSEIFVDCPLAVCEQRDVKGLYAKARRGEISDFTGVGGPFEAPALPDLHLRTGESSVAQSLQALVSFISQNSPTSESIQ